MKKEIVFGLLFVMVLLVITGCTGGFGSTDGYIISNAEYFQGTDSLEMEFFENVPPDEVLEGTEFDISIDVNNAGAYFLTGYLSLSIEEDFMCILDDNDDCFDIDDVGSYDAGTLSLLTQITSNLNEIELEINELMEEYETTTDSDKRQELFEGVEYLEGIYNSFQKEKMKLLSGTISEKTQVLMLEPRSIYNPSGGVDMITFKARAKSPGQLSEKHESAIIASACYAYSTQLEQEVCLDTDIGHLSVFDPVCDTEDIMLNSQGAPLAITKIETNIIPFTDSDGTEYIRPQFVITVKNMEEGSIINSEKTSDACSAIGLDRYDYDMVVMNKLVLSNENIIYRFNGYNTTSHKEFVLDNDPDTIECTSSPIRLDSDGEGKIRCTVKEGVIKKDQASYSTQLYMEFDYGYMHSISKEIVIEKSYVN